MAPGKSSAAAGESKYLAQGTYGCVMRPAQSCPEDALAPIAEMAVKTKRTLKSRIAGIFSRNAAAAAAPPASASAAARGTRSNTVAKLFADEGSYTEEVGFQRQIERIDPAQKFTVPIVQNCRISRTRYAERELRKCDGYAEFASRIPQIVYNGDGSDLHKVLSERLYGATFADLFLAMEPVFAGLVALGKAGVVHQDIKPANIIYYPNERRCALIDFGLMVGADEVYGAENRPICQTVYRYYPPEYQYALELRSRNLRRARIVEIAAAAGRNQSDLAESDAMRAANVGLGAYKEYADVAPVGAVQRARLVKLVTEWVNYRTVVSGRGMSALPEKFAEFTDRVDVHMLGVTLLELLARAIGAVAAKPALIDRANERFIGRVLELVSDMTDPVPSARLTAKNALKRYKAVAAQLKKTYKRAATPALAPQAATIAEPPAPQIAAAPALFSPLVKRKAADSVVVAAEDIMSPGTQQDLFNSLALAGRVTRKPVTPADLDIKIIEVSAAQMPNSFALSSEPAGAPPAKGAPAAAAPAKSAPAPAPAAKTAADRSRPKKAARSL